MRDFCQDGLEKVQSGIYEETGERKFPDDNVCSRRKKQLVEVPFEDITVKIPCGYDAILTRCYGDYMKLPDEKDRVNHMPVEIQFPGEEVMTFGK